jgi:hypothetical protein
MKPPTLRRHWVVLAAVLILAVAAFRLLDRPSQIFYYRVADDCTLAVGTSEGVGAWTWITDLSETPSTVTITVSSLYVRLGPATDSAVWVESLAKLGDAIGGRTVIDGSSGIPVVRTRCVPPAYLAAGCS